MEETQNEKDQRNKEFPQDFRMRFQVILDDIKYIKSRQWSVTYYLLLLFAAIIGFSSLLNHGCLERSTLLTIAILVALLGTFYQVDFQTRLFNYRKRLIDKVLPNLSDKFQKTEKEPPRYTSWFRDFWAFTFPFILMIWFGAFFVFWHLFL